MKIYLILILLITFVSSPAFALSSDKQKTAYLQANNATINHKTGISIYRGNVKLTQGTTVITGDTVIVYTDHHNHLQKAIAIGQLASYSTLPDNSKLIFNAVSRTINYYPLQAKVEFVENAKATHGKDVYAGPRINYDINDEIVTSPSSGEGRTTITLQPNQQEQ